MTSIVAEMRVILVLLLAAWLAGRDGGVFFEN
jgi:hypothetical protein